MRLSHYRTSQEGPEISYQDDLAALAQAQVEAIADDLDRARQELRLRREDVANLERHVFGLEWLLGHTQDKQVPPRTAGLTLHDAMREVLRGAPEQMMRAGDLAATIESRRLYRMRDGRAVEPQQIHARAGNYPQFFTREGTFIKLVERGDGEPEE